MYRVINRFKDKDDHIYDPGDPYPRNGKATKKRLAELSAIHPKYKVAFIKEVKESKKKE